jgi:HEAT repeat protein
MNGKNPTRLVNVMPKHNPTIALPQLTRATIAILAGGFLLLLCASGTTHAAIQQEAAPDDSFLSPWTYSTIILVLMLVGLVIYKKRRGASQSVGVPEPVRSPERTARSENSQPTASRGPVEASTPRERRAPAAERRAPVIEGAQVWERPAPVEVETSIYGAYRIDQEVGKLVLGKPHRMDVMASRAPDDRRAIEASLVKALESWDNDSDARSHAREALEEYGFVARQSATMLMGRDAWERSSAARTLGQIGSPNSLIFLIEALHDADSVVRNQAVASLGALKMPAAIGALLDIARRHPDIPAALLSETLSACSVESLGYLDASSEPALFAGGNSSAEPRELGTFLAFEDLPEGSEDDALTESLTRLASSDEHVRAQAISELASRRVQRSVTALSTVALSDPDSGVRSAAVSGLGLIDHESGFATILVALADVSREVRAAAARTLSGLSFDRADAYVRVMETADPETLQNVARACIKTGIVAQAVNRLASEDRHQAYEAFSLLSLLAKGNETQPILDAIQDHKDEEVRLCAIRVLNVAAQPDLAPTLRDLASGEGLTDNVRTAILEVLYKLDQDQPVFDLGSSDNGAMSLHNSL